MASLKLSQVPVGSSFIDSNSTYNSQVLEWCVVAHGVDEEDVTTLILKDSNPYGYKTIDLPFDAQEPTNPDINKRNYGNPSYEYSNILQWLNSDKLANQWFIPQHEYDQSPTSEYVANSGYAYSSKDGFLAHFSEGFKESLVNVEKYGTSRKVHLPADRELFSNIQSHSDNNTVYDVGETYGTYVFGIATDEYMLYVRGNNSIYAPISRVYASNGTVHYIAENLESSKQYPYQLTGSKAQRPRCLPMVFMKSNTRVSYNTSDQKYYANYDNVPIISVNNNLGQHKTEFSFNFSVSDADGDTVSVKAYVDDSETAIFNNTVSLDTPTQITVPASVMSGLEYGNHTVKIVADDGDKTSTATPIFEKYDIAPAVSVQSDLGQKKYTFSFTFRISDADDTKSSVTVKLDNTQIYSDNNAPLDTDITVQISTADFSALTYDTHTLMITADDGVKTGTATASFQKIELSVPVITADEIGNKVSEFTSTYQVSSDSADSIDVIVKLDNVEIDNKTNVAQDTDIILAVSASRFNALSYGNHEIDIIATDNDGYSSTKPLTFKKCSTPTVRMSVPVIVEEPFSVEVTANSADGDNITLKAYIDNREINV